MLILILTLTLCNLITFYMMHTRIISLKNKIASMESRLIRIDKATDYTAIDKRKEKIGL